MEHPGQAVDGRDHVEEYERDGRREGDREEPAEDFMSDLTRHGSLFIGSLCTRPGNNPCERGLRKFVPALGRLFCPDLFRYVESGNLHTLLPDLVH